MFGEKFVHYLGVGHRLSVLFPAIQLLTWEITDWIMLKMVIFELSGRKWEFLMYSLLKNITQYSSVGKVAELVEERISAADSLVIAQIRNVQLNIAGCDIKTKLAPRHKIIMRNIPHFCIQHGKICQHPHIWMVSKVIGAFVCALLSIMNRVLWKEAYFTQFWVRYWGYLLVPWF